jgi:hypothetical protein
VSSPMGSAAGALPGPGERRTPIATNALNEYARMIANLPMITDAVQFRTQLRIIVNQGLAFTRQIPDDLKDLDRHDQFVAFTDRMEVIRNALRGGSALPETTPTSYQNFEDVHGRGYTVASGGARPSQVFERDVEVVGARNYAEADNAAHRKSNETLLGYHMDIQAFLSWGGIYTTITEFRFTVPDFTDADWAAAERSATGKVDASRRLRAADRKALPEPVDASFSFGFADDGEPPRPEEKGDG